MAFEVRLLGSVEALVDGHSLSLGGSKQRSVVAMLALHANTTLSGDRLIDGLWGDDPPASAAKMVQLHVSRLRKALAESRAEAEILTRGHGYQLRLPARAVDALRFERLVEEAARERASGGVNGAARSALELWRGAPLAGVADEPFALPEIRRLEELHLRALELAVDAELAAGNHGEVTAELEALIAEEPLRERFHAQRMLALYRDGRQSEALDAYREARKTLIEQIGVEPGPELQDLQAAILAQDPSLDAPPRTQELPAQLEGGSPLLAGRERDLGWLRERWKEAAGGDVVVVLVVGPAGIGKTRLVAELATEVQGGGGLVLCAASGDVPETALASVGRAEQSERPALLVLDDADDAPAAVLAAAAGLAREHGGRSLLICVVHRDEQGPPPFAALLETGSAERLRLGRLPDEAVAEIAALYAPAEGVPMPPQTLIAASEGVPLHVHRVAGEWARAEVADRLFASAGRAADERSGLRAAEASVAGDVVDLQAAAERINLYGAEEPPDGSALAVCPYRGLAPFDAAHAEYFFGRERLIAELVARLVGSTLLAVVGPSGSGKSSAVRAGLLPALASGVVPGSERWRQAVIRPGERPLAELSRGLARTVLEAGHADGAPPIPAALDQLTTGERLVLVVDQFEETFSACRDAVARAAFLDALVEGAGDRDERLIVVIAIRADFYADCAQHAALATQIGSNQVLVGPMRRVELRRTIELPARKAGLRVEPRLVSALVGDVAGEPGGLPLLSAALLELWQRRSRLTLRYEDYERSGGVQGAVARLAEDAYQRLSEAERRRARPMLLRLAGDGEGVGAFVRRRVPLNELEVDRDENAAGALAVLTESRLLTVDEGAVEVAHEALLREWPRLRSWLEQDAEGRRLHHHLIAASREWRDSGRDTAELYRGARLAAALDWAASHDPELNELERAFLDESRAASEREAGRQRRANQRLRTLLAGVGVLLAAAVLAGVIALSERQGARSAATAEAAQRLGAQALTEDRLDHAALLANTGVALDDSLATRSSLLSTLLRNPAVLGVLPGDGDELMALALSPDGRTLALGDEDGTVRLFDTETRERLGDYQARGFITALAFDPHGRSLAISAKYDPRGALNAVKNYLHILDAATLRPRSSAPLGRPPSDGSVWDYVPLLTYASDGRSVIVGQADGGENHFPLFLRRFDVRSGSPLGSPARVAPSGSYWAGLLSAPDGRLLYATPDATYAIDPKALRVVRRYPVGGLSAGISADGATLAIGGKDGRVRLLDLASGRVQTLSDRHQAPVESEAFSPDGRRLATAAEDGNVIVWDPREGRATETLAGQTASFADLALSPDGRTLYTASSDSTVLVWDVAGDRRLGRPFATGLARIPEDRFPPGFALSPDGRGLAVARLDGRVDLIDAETLRRTGSFEAFHRLKTFRTPAIAIEYTPDGRWLAVAGGRGLVGLWDAGSRQRADPLLHAPSRRGPCAGRPTFSPCFEATVQALTVGEGGLLAAAGIGGVVRIWDLDSRKQIGPPLHLPRIVTGMAFSPDGSQLAITTGYLTAEPDRVEVRDPRSGEPLARLPTGNGVRSVAFSPDGRLLAAGQVDGGTLIWETDSWRRVGRPLPLAGAQVLGLAFSPDGRTLATSHDDGTVVLWDVESQQPIGSPLPGPTGRWVTARFTPDGSRLFAVYDNGRAFRWELDPAVWMQHACAVAGGGLTPEQWEEIVPEQDYISVCPSAGAG